MAKVTDPGILANLNGGPPLRQSSVAGAKLPTDIVQSQGAAASSFASAAHQRFLDEQARAAQVETERKAAAQQRALERDAGFVLNRTMRAISESGVHTNKPFDKLFHQNTGIAGALSGLPWTDAGRLVGTIAPIKTNLQLGKLMEMRANSPNQSSGLGVASDRDMEILAKTAGDLNPSLGEDRLDLTLREVQHRFVEFLRQNGYTNAQINAATAVHNPPPDSVMANRRPPNAAPNPPPVAPRRAPAAPPTKSLAELAKILGVPAPR